MLAEAADAQTSAVKVTPDAVDYTPVIKEKQTKPESWITCDNTGVMLLAESGR